MRHRRTSPPSQQGRRMPLHDAPGGGSTDIGEMKQRCTNTMPSCAITASCETAGALEAMVTKLLAF